ncbi:glycine betaine/L-proline ABC transporter permease ProW [Castellaniella sp.]|uniref:glycine betaine/L-proline ABC transporter permease ProW n=1 Tax=Castellaniella sp. TaxID=1955812 RepID=UPI0035673DC3
MDQTNPDPWAALSGQDDDGSAATTPSDAATEPDDPWAAMGDDGAVDSSDPWSAMSGGDGTGADAGGPANGWLSSPSQDSATDAQQALSADPGLSWQQIWDGTLPIQDWINQSLDWIVLHFRAFFQALRQPVDVLLSYVDAVLQYPSAPVMIAILSLIAWQLAGRFLGLATLFSLLLVITLGVWQESMITLSLVLTSLVFCVLIGIPLGIWLARSDTAERICRPFLDAMQTTPAFVYLVPVVMLFGIGNVPGVIVTIIFALPPLVRLTNLGIRQVRPDLVEAAKSYGASPWQLLRKVQLPLAMPSIMAGINQCLMLSLSMVVIASMIAVGGLGQMVLRGIGRLDMGLAVVGGLGIVILAIVLDRITQTLGKAKRNPHQRWYMSGPVGIFWRLAATRREAAEPQKTAQHPKGLPSS